MAHSKPKSKPDKPRPDFPVFRHKADGSKRFAASFTTLPRRRTTQRPKPFYFNGLTKRMISLLGGRREQKEVP